MVGRARIPHPLAQQQHARSGKIAQRAVRQLNEGHQGISLRPEEVGERRHGPRHVRGKGRRTS